MDYQALADEINNDPQGMGYSAHLPEDHVSVANLLGQDDPAGAVVYESLSSEKATRIAAEVDAYSAIKADSENSSSSTQSQSLAAWTRPSPSRTTSKTHGRPCGARGTIRSYTRCAGA